MTYDIESNALKVSISDKGAELASIQRTDTGQEYLWSGDPAFWGKKSPVLFPIVGSLPDDTYTYKGKSYRLTRHGFARDRVFAAEAHFPQSIAFVLRADEASLAVYPFHFELRIQYTVQEATLWVDYTVTNTGTEGELPFSIGAHPAFKVPLNEQLAYQDYYIEMESEEVAGIYPLTADGLLEAQAVPFFQNSRRLPLQKDLFYKDALVFKELASQRMSIKTDKDAAGLTMRFDGFPYFGIWAARDADFVCLEPWHGIASTHGAGTELVEKEGIISLLPGMSATLGWSLEIT